MVQGLSQGGFMSVLIEAHTIIVRCDTVHEKYPGGWEQFVADVPNRTLCSDGEVARVAFMSPADAEMYIIHLESCGLRFCEQGSAVDIAAAFQLNGLKVPCDWLESGRFFLDKCGASVACCRLSGGDCMQLATPATWKYEGSLSQTFGIFPNDSENMGIKFLRHVNGMDVYYDNLAEKEVFVGRTGA
jgi:hypothetical protein